MTVLIEDRESDTERDVCQILEIFSPILLTCLSLQFPPLFLGVSAVLNLTKDFIIFLKLSINYIYIAAKQGAFVGKQHFRRLS